jgi:hypothetical protein
VVMTVSHTATEVGARVGEAAYLGVASGEETDAGERVERPQDPSKI